MRYCPEFFSRPTVENAKACILIPSGGLTTEERWQKETDWLMERISFDDDHGLVVDYGCGIGRLAKQLKNPVLGVDISPIMRQQALEYVGRNSFCAVSPTMFGSLVASGVRACGALAVWSLQHVAGIVPTVNLLIQSIKPGGTFWLLDLEERCIPFIHDDTFFMHDDKINVVELVKLKCELESTEKLDVWTQHSDNPGTLRKFRKKS